MLMGLPVDPSALPAPCFPQPFTAPASWSNATNTHSDRPGCAGSSKVTLQMAWLHASRQALGSEVQALLPTSEAVAAAGTESLPPPSPGRVGGCLVHHQPVGNDPTSTHLLTASGLRMSGCLVGCAWHATAVRGCPFWGVPRWWVLKSLSPTQYLWRAM